MADLFARLSNLLWRGSRGPKRRAHRRRLADEIFPALHVRPLEERRVFHADAIAAPVAGAFTQPSPPPPPTTTISLDANQNLLIQDAAAAGQNNQLSIRLDAEQGYYEIIDPTQTLTTNIAGASGSGSHSVLIPVAAFAGDKLLVATGLGNDLLTADLSSGLAGKSLVFDGGQGHDSLVVVGGQHSNVAYAATDGLTHIQIGAGPSLTQIDLLSAESVLDQLVVDHRQFTLDNGLTAANLTGNGLENNGLLQLTTSSGSHFTFTTPLVRFSLTAADQTSIEISGQTNLSGADLNVHAGTIRVTGDVLTHHATLDLSAHSSLTVAATGRLDNAAGQTFLDAGATGSLQMFGQIDVSASVSSERGGSVHLLGEKVEILGAASIDASGRAGGGGVLVGGDYQGLNPAIRNATTTYVHADASIRANSLADGDGGKIIIWANDSAIVAGSGNLQARGGANGGNGGLIETSGKRYLYVALAPDASAPAGDAGLWLLDPENVTIVSAGTGTLTGGIFTADATDTTIDPAIIAVALNSMNVVINTGSGAGDGDIIIEDAITPNIVGSHTLTLNAARDIVLQDDIDPTAGTLGVILNAGRNIDFVTGSISANTVSINAGGSVNSGSDANDISVSGLGAAISIDAASIAAASQPLELSPGAGSVSLTTQTGSMFARFDVGFSTSQLTLSAAASGQTIRLATENGSILFDSVAGFGINTRDDAFDVQAVGANQDITFASGVTLLADSIKLQAADAILAASATAIADTSATGGIIALSGASLGSAADSLRVNPGAGDLELTATDGDIFVRLTTGNLATSQISLLSAAKVGAIVSIGADSGGIVVDQISQFDPNIANDHFQLASGSGDITLSAGSALTVASATLTATSGNILATVAGTHIDTSASGGLIRLESNGIGDAAQATVIDPGAGNVEAIVASADVLLTFAGSFATGQLTDLNVAAANRQIVLTAVSGSITVNNTEGFDSNTADDNFVLIALTGGISFSGGTLSFSEVTLLADGAISGLSPGTAIDTSAADGNITLLSGGPIGVSSLLPLGIEAGGGQVSAVTTGSLGNIFLESSGDLLLGNIDAQNALPQTISIATTGGAMQIASPWNTEDLIFLTANGDITFLASANIAAAAATLMSTAGVIRGSSGAVADISTTVGPLVLTAQSIGENAVALLIDPGLGLVGIVSAGDAYVNIFDGNFALTRFSVLNLTGSGGTLGLGVANGSLTIDATFAALADDNLVLSAAGAGGNISVAAGAPLIARSVELRASGTILGGGNSADVTAGVGNIALSADQGIGTLAAPLSVSTTNPTALVTATTVTGDVFLASPGVMRLGAVATGNGIQSIEIDAADDLEIVDASSTNDIWLLKSAAGNLHFNGGSTVTANAFTAEVAGLVFTDNAGIDVDTSAANGAVSFTGAALGQGLQHLVLSLGSGNLSLNAVSGDIWIDLDGGSFNSSQIEDLTASGNGAAVSLTTLYGTLTLSDFANFHITDDLLSLTALGASSNIIFFGSGGPLVAAQATLQAGGSILSTGSAPLDINTSLAGNPLGLTAGIDIGHTNAPLIVRAGAGQISAETGAGDIYIQSPGPLLVNRAVATAAGRQISFATTGAGNLLVVDVDSLSTDGDQWHLRATSDLTLRVADAAGIRFGQLIDVAASSPNRNVRIEATSGPIVVDTIHPGIVTADDNLTLLAQTGNITSPTSNPLAAHSLTLQAPGGQIGNAANPVEMSAPHLSTSSATSQWLTTTGTTRIASAGASVPGSTIALLSGTFLLVEPGPGSSTVQTVGGELLVGSAATLGGKGSVAGNLHVLSSGTISPGFGGPGAGSLLIMGDVVFDSNSVLIVNINAPYLDPGTDYDHLVVAGNLMLDNPILRLAGAESLSTTVNPIILVELVDPAATTTGSFQPNAGSLFVENGVLRGVTGQLRGNLLFNGGDGNDIVLSQLSFVPQRPQPVSLLPRLRIPTLTILESPPPVVVTPTLQPTAATPAVVEAESTPIGVRFLEVRIVIVIDEAGNVREDFAMRLSTDWLTNLPAILRRLPDDRYRIYLILEGGNEERLVIDVIVRDGRPVEPGDAAGDPASDSVPSQAQPSDQSETGQAETLPQPPANQPQESLREPSSKLQNGALAPQGSSGAGRLYFGAAAAMAAVVASRQSSGRWTDEVDQAAETIGRNRAPLGWRWWRLASDRSGSAATSR